MALSLSPPRKDSGAAAGWRPVRKRRRISQFSPASEPVVAGAPGLGGKPRCAVELTEVRTGGQDWWTLGFEAADPADLLRSALQASAELVFTQPLPGGVEPGPDQFRSYAEWLGQSPAPTVTPTPEARPPPSRLARHPGPTLQRTA